MIRQHLPIVTFHDGTVDTTSRKDPEKWVTCEYRGNRDGFAQWIDKNGDSYTRINVADGPYFMKN